MIRQTRNRSLAQSLQFVRFEQRLGSIFHLLADTGTLRLGKIMGGLYVTDSNGCVTTNLYPCAVRKSSMVEGHVRCTRAREIAAQNLSFMSGRTGNRGDMSFDRRALWNRDSRAGVNRLAQVSCY